MTDLDARSLNSAIAAIDGWKLFRSSAIACAHPAYIDYTVLLWAVGAEQLTDSATGPGLVTQPCNVCSSRPRPFTACREKKNRNKAVVEIKS